MDQPSFVPASVFTDVGLTELQYQTAVRDTSDDSIFYDATEGSTDDDLYIDFGDLTLSHDDDDLDLYSVPSEGSSLEHGERIYRHIDGYDIRVFVSETK